MTLFNPGLQQKKPKTSETEQQYLSILCSIHNDLKFRKEALIYILDFHVQNNDVELISAYLVIYTQSH